MRRLFAAFFLFSMFAVAVPSFGDIARPTPSSKPGKFVTHSGLEIVPDAKAYEARLEIPQDLFREMRAGLADVPADPNLARRIAHSSPRTILAGVFLFMSVSFAGVWLARSRQRNQKIIAAVVLAMALLGAATIITKANAGPPGYVRWQGLPQALTDGRSTQAGVDIVIVSEGSGVKLIVPMRKANRNPGEE